MCPGGTDENHENLLGKQSLRQDMNPGLESYPPDHDVKSLRILHIFSYI
jgi:hypothetical protein